MDRKLISKIKQKSGEYVDVNREKKATLTDFVDNYFLTYNANQLKLMKLVYEGLEPVMRKYGTFLVFKGGNVMRMINKNIMEYLPPNADHLITDIFAPFLKQSDNDFTVFLNPNLHNYETIVRQLSLDIFFALDRIKKIMVGNLPFFFNLFNLSDQRIVEAFRELRGQLNTKYVKLAPHLDQEIIFSNPRNPKSDVLVYEIPKSLYHFIYNTLNFALEFKDIHDQTIKFYLCRSKVNFRLNHTNDISGELIDISIPHKDDFAIKQLSSTSVFQKFLENNIVREHNKEFNFDYYVINVHYIVHDLVNILFTQNISPWDANKYNKRLARLIYFIWIDAVNNESTLSIQSLGSISRDYYRFIYQVQQLPLFFPNNRNHNVNLQDLIKRSSELKNNTSPQFEEYLGLLQQYAEAIIRITNTIIQFLSGKQNVDKNLLYQLNVV